MSTKLEETILYICHKLSDCPKEMGKTQLNKILYFSDVEKYMKDFTSISGSTYNKMPYGPVPAKIDIALDNLQRDMKLVIKRNGNEQYKFISIVEPNYNAFTSLEISIIDKHFEDIIYNHTAKSISKKSHDIVWEYSEIGEEMPLGFQLVSKSSELTMDDLTIIDLALKEVGMKSCLNV